ncbi:MAG: LamG-like jellyroll fold domain-containing protein, partial [Planctomycetota bacterium]
MNKKGKNVLTIAIIAAVLILLLAVFINAKSYTYDVSQNPDGSVKVLDSDGEDVSGIWAWLSKYISLGGNAVTGQATYSAAQTTMPGFILDTGTSFTVTDSGYLDVTVTSTEVLTMNLVSMTGLIDMAIDSDADLINLTITNMEALTEYYMYDDDYRNLIIFTTDASGSYTWEQEISQSRHVWIQTQPSSRFIYNDIYGGECEGKLIDDSVSTNDARVVGATLVGGQVGNTANIATGNYLRATDRTDELDVTDVVTMEAWVNLNNYPEQWNLVMVKGTGGSTRNYGMWVRNTGDILLSYYNGGYILYYPSGQGFTTGGWHHVVGIIDTVTDYKA